MGIRFPLGLLFGMTGILIVDKFSEGTYMELNGSLTPVVIGVVVVITGFVKI